MSDEKIPPAMTIAEAMALDTSITIETDLAVALVAIKKGRDLIEDCADADDPTRDAPCLREVYAQLITAMHGVAAGLTAVRYRSEMREAIAKAATEPAPAYAPVGHLRLVK